MRSLITVGFSLAGNYFDNFSAANTGTTEMIFAIPYDQVYYGGFNLAATDPALFQSVHL